MNESRYDFEILLIDRDCEYEIVRLIQIQFLWNCSNKDNSTKDEIPFPWEDKSLLWHGVGQILVCHYSRFFIDACISFHNVNFKQNRPCDKDNEKVPWLRMWLLSSFPQKNSLKEWSFKRAVTIRTYRDYHPIPVPLNLVSQPVLALRKGSNYELRDKLDNEILQKKVSSSLLQLLARFHFLPFSHLVRWEKHLICMFLWYPINVFVLNETPNSYNTSCYFLFLPGGSLR